MNQPHIATSTTIKRHLASLAARRVEAYQGLLSRLDTARVLVYWAHAQRLLVDEGSASCTDAPTWLDVAGRKELCMWV